MSVDLFIKNGKIVTEDAVVLGGVVIDQGKIIQIVSRDVDVDAKETLDLKDKYLLPGVVDSHAHLNQPGRDHWEGYETGTRAAAAGGITTVLEMPLNATPPTIDLEALEAKRSSVRPDAVIDYGFWGGFVDNNLAELATLNAEGVVAYKAFMSNSGVDFERIDDDLLYAGLLASKELGNIIGVHAESEYVAAYLGAQMHAAGRTDRASWYQSRPPMVELEAIQRACYWAKASEGNLHIVHVTISDGIRSVAQAKLEGAHVTVETCPHYLYFDEQDFERLGPVAKCAPPIRSREEVEKLWECVLSGLVDTIGSDHSPCTWEDKQPGLDNIWKAWGGLSGIQSMLPVMLSEGVNKRGLSLPALMKMLATNPARLFGLYPRKGAVLPGADADFAVVDLEREWTLSKDQLFYKNKHSPYIGNTFRGQVERTIVRGTTVYADQQIQVEPGFGQWLPRLNRYTY